MGLVGSSQIRVNSKLYWVPLGHLFFLLFFALIHIPLIAFFNFIHFHLGHSFSVIDGWALVHASLMVLLSKGLAFIIVFRFYAAQFYGSFSWRSLLSHLALPRYSFCLGVASFWPVVLIGLGPVKVLPSLALHNFFSLLMVYLNTLPLYGLDLLWAYLLLAKVDYKQVHFRFGVLIMALAFILTHNETLTYAMNRRLVNGLPFMILCILMCMRKNNGIEVLLFLLGIVVPLSAFFGVNNLLLGKEQAVFAFSVINGQQFFIFLWFGVILYLGLSRIFFRSEG